MFPQPIHIGVDSEMEFSAKQYFLRYEKIHSFCYRVKNANHFSVKLREYEQCLQICSVLET